MTTEGWIGGLVTADALSGWTVTGRLSPLGLTPATATANDVWKRAERGAGLATFLFKRRGQQEIVALMILMVI